MKSIASQPSAGSLLLAAPVFVALLPPAPGLAQRYSPPPPPLTVDPCAIRADGSGVVPPDPRTKPLVCPPPAPAASTSAPPAGDRFPFPGDSSPAPQPANKFPFPGEPVQTPSAPAKTADPFPYPGDTTKSADAAPNRPIPDDSAGAPAGTSDTGSSSSSSDGTSSSSDNALPKPTGDDAEASAHSRRRLPKVSAVSPEERVAEDLDVAKFYAGRGNFQAAYLRSKDATRVMPGDAESHFSLAQAAQRLQRRDEAAAEYTLYLKLDPAGDKRAAAETALASLR